MSVLNDLVGFLNNILWTYVLIGLLISLGIWFSVKTNFVQIRLLKEMCRLVSEGAGAKPRAGHISTFQAFCVSAASRVGVGNIAGIAIAVVVGGPGAIFWMWVIATIGAATGFVESTLAQIYKEPKKHGTGFVGGPAYYIKNVIGSPFFAMVFAILISVTYGLIFNSVQANTIASSIEAAFEVPTLVTAVVIACLTALVLLGGMARIAKVASFMVPIMALLYISIVLVVMALNITMVPTVLVEIVRQAFDFDAAMGAGFAVAMMTGIKRGLFSNEAGMGAVPNAAAVADASHPVKQGLVQALGVYIDTLVICTASAMLVMLSPDWQTSGKTGIALAQHALSGQLGSWTEVFMMVMIFFFAFSSIIGNYFYGEVNMGFITKKPIGSKIYRVMVVGMVFFGSIASLNFVWNLADLFMALMAVVNLVAISILGKYAFVALKDYCDQKARGIKEPEFDPKVMPSQVGIKAWPRQKSEEMN